MEKKDLMNEYKVTLESLVSKTRFIYSEEFYKLDDFEKQKYNKDKMTTEAHLSTLCELLWGKKVQFDSGLGNMFALSLISSMFNGGGFGSSPLPLDTLKKELDNAPVVKEPEKKPSKRTKKN